VGIFCFFKPRCRKHTIAGHYGVHPNMVTQWKKQAIDSLPDVFSTKHERSAEESETLHAQLYQQIGQLKVELDWLKKKLDCSVELKRSFIEPAHSSISIARQCELTGLSRSSFYYDPASESAENIQLMRLIDEQFTRTPFYGVRKMTAWLCKKTESAINPKRVRRLMRLMGLETIYQKPRLSVPALGHQIYPYLLRGLKVDGANHVWSTDITYIRLQGGFIYLVAIIDWFSRYVLSWEISTTMESDFCISALQRALYGQRPKIFNNDQGSQFTSNAFTGILKDHGILISMDGRGRALDNIFVERLWRSVKYEEVYLHDYETVPQAIERLRKYFLFYNGERLHQSLEYKTPETVYRMSAC
jgi:putative transposase